MTRILTHTDVCVGHLRGRAFRPRGDRVHYSTVTRVELFAGGDERRIREFLEPLAELPVERSVAERAGRIAREAEVRLPDALIAPTAADHRLVLVTRNQRDFRRVRGLRVRAPS